MNASGIEGILLASKEYMNDGSEPPHGDVFHKVDIEHMVGQCIMDQVWTDSPRELTPLIRTLFSHGQFGTGDAAGHAAIWHFMIGHTLFQTKASIFDQWETGLSLCETAVDVALGAAFSCVHGMGHGILLFTLDARRSLIGDYNASCALRRAAHISAHDATLSAQGCIAGPSPQHAHACGSGVYDQYLQNMMPLMPYHDYFWPCAGSPLPYSCFHFTAGLYAKQEISGQHRAFPEACPNVTDRLCGYIRYSHFTYVSAYKGLKASVRLVTSEQQIGADAAALWNEYVRVTPSSCQSHSSILSERVARQCADTWPNSTLESLQLLPAWLGSTA